MTLTCSDCASPITKASKTGRCRPCAAKANHRDPAFRARLEASIRIAKATPEHRARARAATLKREAERRDDPEWRAYKVAAGQKLRAIYEASPAAQAANLARRADVGAKNSFRRLGWLPDRLRRRYVCLRSKIGAAEAKRTVMADMSPFERQMARLAAGAQLVAAPDFRTPDPAFTLGGIASASF